MATDCIVCELNQKYPDADIQGPHSCRYLVTGKTVDDSQIAEHVTAVSARHAAAKVHISSAVPMTNTYRVVGLPGTGTDETINDMQAYLQCERFGD